MKDFFITQVRPNYRLLTGEQIIEIHRASLEILETIGVQILHEEALDLLRDSGCRIKTDNIVLFPNWLVEESIQSAPSRITIYNRKGIEAMRLEGRNNYFGTGTDLIRTLDIDTGERRLSVLKDVANAARISDYCENVDFIASYALPSDVPTNIMYLQSVREIMRNSIKPIFFTAAGKEDLAYIIKIAEEAVGGENELRSRPYIIHYSEPTAPLRHSNGAINKLLLCAEKGIPICYTPGDILGASAPVTLAGGIVQANAEALSGIVLHQLKAKGSPIISGFAVVPMDMRTTSFCYGAPEWRLTNSAFADLYHHYQIPMWSTVGSDSHCLDEQVAMEHAFGTLMAAMDGANLIHDIGYLGQGLLGSPGAIVMCDEIISYVKRILQGFELDRNRMAFDVISDVGPGGNFLAEKHTKNYFRHELWRPKQINRENPDKWVDDGRHLYSQRVMKKAKEILLNHQPEPISMETDNLISKITQDAEVSLTDYQFQA